MRKQTDKDFFGVEDGALQAPDQEKISTEDLKGLRGIYEEKHVFSSNFSSCSL